jgi:hypothetical protein
MKMLRRQSLPLRNEPAGVRAANFDSAVCPSRAAELEARRRALTVAVPRVGLDH